MKLRAIIVDDEFKGINSLHILLERHCPDVKSVAETRSPITAVELIENYLPDIVFLDINMPEMDGFELLRKLKWKKFHLIFTTAHEEHALKALKSNATDYLLKPIDPEELKLAVNKVKIQNKEAQMQDPSLIIHMLADDLLYSPRNKILIHSKNGLESIPIQDIISMESKSNYTQINLPDSKHVLSSKTLKEFEEILCPESNNFMRVHNSFIVNLNKVSRYLKSTENIVMIDTQIIPISKSKKDVFLTWLNI